MKLRPKIMTREAAINGWLSFALLLLLATNVEASRGLDEEQGRSCSEEREFKVDATSGLIYVDECSQSGYISATIDSQQVERNETDAKRQAQKDSPTIDLDIQNKQTNYSIYLLSRHKEHVALEIEFTEIDFEPVINCEFQRLSFEIVGEISKDLLQRQENDLDKQDEKLTLGESSMDPKKSVEDSKEDEAEAEEEAEEEESEDEEEGKPAVPVAEAMALLMNNHLNKTITDESSETNQFKLIDATIDYLRQSSCKQLAQLRKQNISSLAKANQKAGSRSRGQSGRRKSLPKPNNRANEQPRAGKPSNKVVARNRDGSSCSVEAGDNDEFRRLMVKQLDDNFDWHLFKMVCGKTRRLIFPMRSLKISVYGDEFSARSSFKLRYRFLANISELPALDNDKYYCRNRNVIDVSLRCDGYDDCGDASDESTKICGYPPLKPTNKVQHQQHSFRGRNKADHLASHSSLSGNPAAGKRRPPRHKLSHIVSGELLHCCQTSKWLSLVAKSQPEQTGINLPSLISDSMSLFSAPLFAPTSKGSPSVWPPEAGRRNKRIVGGGPVQRGTWPAQASLQHEIIEPLSHFCAGTLIHPQYVLTAGHCITKTAIERGIKVVFGGHDLRQLRGDHIQERYVDDAQVYPGVDAKHLRLEWQNDMNNDLALLRLNAPVLITDQVAPACLPPYNTRLAANQSCQAIGWGETHGSGNSNLLKQLPFKVEDTKLCSEQWEKLGNGVNETRRASGDESDFEAAAKISDNTMVCVKRESGEGICMGDSGGPLYCDRVNSSGEKCTEIYGVASFIAHFATVGALCAIENTPDVFGDVASKTEWISSTIRMFEQTYKLKYSH